MLDVAMAARVSLRAGNGGHLDGVKIQSQILAACSGDQEVFLDVVDATLRLSPSNGSAQDLRDALELAGSAWTVADHNRALQRRVNETARLAAQAAMSPNDLASEELREAWAAAYDRSPNPSDAWDHSIKAVEAVLIPLVVPNQNQPQFGHALGQLKGQGGAWRFEIPGPQQGHEVEPLVEILKLLWPNPDRHANGQGRPPLLEEAQAVVHLAVTVVQWIRAGALRKR
ncbi:hypothetical protein [Nonomuraea sp. NPDC050310]|uniref:hypothetical protein n=1 Tax=Nonomuraea sp. NPDC050310 TaxID=3154935 RepID=UPI0033F97084